MTELMCLRDREGSTQATKNLTESRYLSGCEIKSSFPHTRRSTEHNKGEAGGGGGTQITSGEKRVPAGVLPGLSWESITPPRRVTGAALRSTSGTERGHCPGTPYGVHGKSVLGLNGTYYALFRGGEGGERSEGEGSKWFGRVKRGKTEGNGDKTASCV